MNSINYTLDIIEEAGFPIRKRKLNFSSWEIENALEARGVRYITFHCAFCNGEAYITQYGNGSCFSCKEKWKDARYLLRLLHRHTAWEGHVFSPDLGGEAPAASLSFLDQEQINNDRLPNAIVEDLLYEGLVTNLAGAAKVGKSVFAQQLIASVVNGEEFLGFSVKRVPVWHLCLEMTAGMVWQRYLDLEKSLGLKAPEVGPCFHLSANTLGGEALRLDLSDSPGLDHLEREMQSQGIGLLVLDTLYRFTGDLDPNTAAIAKVFSGLGDVAKATGAAILTLDHTRKGDVGGPVSHRAVGSQFKGGACAVNLHLKRTSTKVRGRWQLDMEGWFGTWDKPIAYARPTLDDGPGFGCVRAGASTGEVEFEDLERVFRLAPRNKDEVPEFRSKNGFVEAIQELGISKSKGTCLKWIDRAVEEFGSEDGDCTIQLIPTGNGRYRYRWTEQDQSPAAGER